jgi:hypothetical protein
MKRLWIVFALALAASLTGFARSTANGAAPVAVLIQIHPNPLAFFQSGTWQVSGAIADSGTYIKSFGQSAPPDRPPFAPGPFREEFVLSSTRGTLTIREEARLTADLVQVGEWQIESGTRDYADASGHGTVAFSAELGPPPVFTLSLTGEITKVG